MPKVSATTPLLVRPPATVDAKVHSRFDAAVRQADDLAGETVDHPAFGRMSVRDWQQLNLIHASRHLSFLIPRPPPPIE